MGKPTLPKDRTDLLKEMLKVNDQNYGLLRAQDQMANKNIGAGFGAARNQPNDLQRFDIRGGFIQGWSGSAVITSDELDGTGIINLQIYQTSKLIIPNVAVNTLLVLVATILDGQELWISPETANTLPIKNTTGTGSPVTGNIDVGGTDIILEPGNWLQLVFDARDQKWHGSLGTGGGTGSGGNAKTGFMLTTTASTQVVPVGDGVLLDVFDIPVIADGVTVSTTNNTLTPLATGRYAFGLNLNLSADVNNTTADFVLVVNGVPLTNVNSVFLRGFGDNDGLYPTAPFDFTANDVLEIEISHDKNVPVTFTFQECGFYMIKVESGGGETLDGANTTLSNLTSPTAINQNLNLLGNILTLDSLLTTSISGFQTDLIQFNTADSLRLQISNTFVTPAVPISMANLNKIVDVNDPDNPQDVATKAYVDSTAGGANTTLTNLTGTVRPNRDLLADQTTGGNLGSATAGDEWFNLFSRRVTFAAATGLGSGDYTFGRVNSPARVQYNVPSGAVHRWTINGNNEMELDNVALSLNGVNLDMENNNITDIDQLQITGNSGDTLRGFISGQAGFFDISANENNSQVRTFARNNGGTLIELIAADAQSGFVSFEQGGLGIGNISNQPIIFRAGNDLNLNVASGAEMNLSVALSTLLNLTSTDINIPTGKFLDITDNVSSANSGSSTLPSNPSGFAVVKIGGIERRIPFYQV